MHPTPEYVRLVQREREAQIESDRLARFAACLRACCNPTLLDRVTRVLRGAPVAC